MKNINRKFDFTLGIFDNMTDKIKMQISENAKKCEYYGIGIYSDNIVIEKYMTYPLNTIEERIKIAKQCDGVDFVFEVNSVEQDEIKKIVINAFENYIENKE